MTYLSLVGVVVMNGISQDSHHLTLSLCIRLGETDQKLADAGPAKSAFFHSLSFCSKARKIVFLYQTFFIYLFAHLFCSHTALHIFPDGNGIEALILK